MAQSPEYPDLLWMPPKSWTEGRPAVPRVIVIHTTEGHEHFQAAEDGAAYNQRRTDGTSAHYFVDPDSIVHCVRTRDQAHTARRQGNRIGIQYELCGRAGQTDAQWNDANSTAILQRAAKQAARDARKYGIPVVKLTPKQLRDGGRGFVGHVDCTYAFPEDNGDHTDPGPRFPWAEFLALVTEHLEEDMPLTDADVAKVANAVWAHTHVHPTIPGAKQAKGTVMQYMDAVHDAQTGRLLTALQSLGVELGETLDVNEDAIVAGVLAGLPPEKIAAAIPPDIAQQVVDQLLDRIAAARQQA